MSVDVLWQFGGDEDHCPVREQRISVLLVALHAREVDDSGLPHL